MRIIYRYPPEQRFSARRWSAADCPVAGAPSTGTCHEFRRRSGNGRDNPVMQLMDGGRASYWEWSEIILRKTAAPHKWRAARAQAHSCCPRSFPLRSVGSPVRTHSARTADQHTAARLQVVLGGAPSRLLLRPQIKTHRTTPAPKHLWPTLLRRDVQPGIATRLGTAKLR